MHKDKKEKTPFQLDMERDLNTIKSLSGKQKLEHIWIYYKYYIAAALFILITLLVFGRIIIEGHRDYRLRATVVLNTDYNSSSWFDEFEKELTSDEMGGRIDVNVDQPFDYDNKYYYVQELEVMTTISSYRMDIAVCGPDMYSYLLALNACLKLDEALPEDLYQTLDQQGRMVQSTANLQIQEDGSINESEGIDGIFAVDLTGTSFYNEYDINEENAPLYAVIIRNTENVPDCVSLIRRLADL